jgi:hypothetical protein
MARWRAVPTAVSTAVGALAFLASTGLAIVLGAGLHVWSGPSSTGSLPGPGIAGPPSVTGRVGGVVTVPAPPATPRLPGTGPGGATQTLTLPFIPFAPAAVPAPQGPAPQGPQPQSSPAVPGKQPRAGGLPLSLRALLDRLRALESSGPAQRHSLRADRAHLDADNDGRHGHGHGRALGHRKHRHGFGHHGRGHAYAWGHRHGGWHDDHGRWERRHADGRGHHGWHGHRHHRHHRDR